MCIQKENITRPIHVGLKVVKKVKKEEVLEVQIILRGCIICNTCKILFLKLIIALYYH